MRSAGFTNVEFERLTEDIAESVRYLLKVSPACVVPEIMFIRPGDPSIPILYDVDRARDGASFTTRRVRAIQHGEQIFNLAASFQVHEEGFEHQAPMPDVPPPDDLADSAEQYKAMLESMPELPEMARRMMGRPRPVWTRAVSEVAGTSRGPRSGAMAQP